MSPNCSSVGFPAVALVKGKLSVWSFEGCQSSGSQAMHCGSYAVDHPQGVPILKVCYCRYCLQFAEIDPAFKLNTGIRCWVGLRITEMVSCWRVYLYF
jgi:hypothetical protein